MMFSKEAGQLHRRTFGEISKSSCVWRRSLSLCRCGFVSILTANSKETASRRLRTHAESILLLPEGESTLAALTGGAWLQRDALWQVWVVGAVAVDETEFCGNGLRRLLDNLQRTDSLCSAQVLGQRKMNLPITDAKEGLRLLRQTFSHCKPRSCRWTSAWSSRRWWCTWRWKQTKFQGKW